MPRVYPLKWKSVRLTEDTHAVLQNMKRPNESFSQVISRMMLFYSHMLYDMENEEWRPEEPSVCPKPIDMSSFGVDE